MTTKIFLGDQNFPTPRHTSNFKIFRFLKIFCRRIVLIRWIFVYLYKMNSVVKFLDGHMGVKSTTVKITGQILAIFG